MNDPFPWLVVLFLIFFAAVWTFALVAVARMGGWSRLAARYRCREPFEGFRIRFGSGEMRGGPFWGLPCNYGGCLALGANVQGLYLAVFPLFRPGHPPLFIPWQDLKGKVERGWLFTYVAFEFPQVAPVRLRISRGTAQRLAAEAGTADAYTISPPG
jgi:hypothetical protein